MRLETNFQALLLCQQGFLPEDEESAFFGSGELFSPLVPIPQIMLQISIPHRSVLAKSNFILVPPLDDVLWKGKGDRFFAKFIF